MNPRLSLFVLRVRQELLKKSVDFYQCLGFSFKEERHGQGPLHYTSESNGYVFELYPLLRDEGYPQPHARLGFQVTKEAIERLQNYKSEDNFAFICDERPYGFVSKDPMGRYIELYVKD